ncbi:hypothetical protein M0804_004929 [Polistes exclamans]|nr:hypothetical protein M0804_004929 [Polistes exclamans]
MQTLGTREEHRPQMLTQYPHGSDPSSSLAGHVARVDMDRATCKILNGRLDEKRPLSRPRRRSLISRRSLLLAEYFQAVALCVYVCGAKEKEKEREREKGKRDGNEGDVEEKRKESCGWGSGHRTMRSAKKWQE